MNKNKAWHGLETLAFEMLAPGESPAFPVAGVRTVCRNTAEPKKLRPRPLSALEYLRRKVIKQDVAFVKCLRRQITNRERKGDMSLFSREVGLIWEEKIAGLRKLGYTKRL